MCENDLGDYPYEAAIVLREPLTREVAKSMGKLREAATLDEASPHESLGSGRVAKPSAAASQSGRSLCLPA